MEIPDYEPFYLQSLDALRAEITRLGLDIPLEENPASLALPLQIGSRLIPNRFCAQPISGADALDDGSPSQFTRERYIAYAKGLFGLIWLERTAAPGHEKPRHLCLSPSNVLPFATMLADIRSKCEPPPMVVLQLAPGRPESLVAAAKLAMEAGFDGVDLQGEPASLPEIFSQIRAALPDLLLSTRFCAYEAVRNGFGVSPTDFRTHDTSHTFKYISRLQESGLQLLNITSASPVLMGPNRGSRAKADHDRPDEHPLMTLFRQLSLVRTFRARFPTIRMVGSGLSWVRQFVPEVAAGAISAHWMDVAGLGRAALACPDLPARVLHHQKLEPSTTCMVCFACTQLERANQSVGCVPRSPERYGPIFRAMRRLEDDRLRAGATRCHLCEAAPCRLQSPTRTDIPAFIKAFREGREREAYALIRASNPLPRLVAETSPFWIEEEGACIETVLSGDSVPIRDIQYITAWRAEQRGETGVRIPPHSSGKTVAIVGGGPTGVAAAVKLLELGHQVRIYETSQTLGGVASRLLLKSRPIQNPMGEIAALLRPAFESGRLTLFLGSTLGKEVRIPDLLEQNDSVLLAVGLWKEHSLGEAHGVVGALDFLEHHTGAAPKRVAVLAGGDSAMDACVALKARGALEVYVLFGGARHELHWHMSEGWFASPGVHALMGWQPVGYTTDRSGNLKGVQMHHAKLGLETVLPVDMAVEAMGLTQADGLFDANNATNTPLYTAGAMVNGGASVGQCIADGLSIAETIHRDLLK